MANGHTIFSWALRLRHWFADQCPELCADQELGLMNECLAIRSFFGRGTHGSDCGVPIGLIAQSTVQIMTLALLFYSFFSQHRCIVLFCLPKSIHFAGTGRKFRTRVVHTYTCHNGNQEVAADKVCRVFAHILFIPSPSTAETYRIRMII